MSDIYVFHHTFRFLLILCAIAGTFASSASAQELSGSQPAMPALSITGYDFGTVRNCTQPEATIVIRNNGTTPVRIGTIYNNQPAVFRIQLPSLPLLLAPNEKFSLAVRFTPVGIGANSFSGTIAVIYIDTVSKSVDSVKGQVIGQSQSNSVQVQIRRDYIAAPGDRITIAATVKDSIDLAGVDTLDISMQYYVKLVEARISEQSDLDAILKGTLLDGWTLESISINPVDQLEDWRELKMRVVAPPGAVSAGSGTLINVLFDVHDDAAGAADFPITVAIPKRYCLQFFPGLGQITVEVADAPLADGDVAPAVHVFPNPLSTSGEILFTLQHAGSVQLEIISATGENSRVVLNEWRAGGNHRVRWESDDLPSGIYFCRIVSDGHTQLAPFVIAR